MAELTLRGVVKRFDAGRPAAVDGVDLEVADGELVCVLGPSGSGKTTLLRLIAGFEVPDAGTITLGGAVVAGTGRSVPPERRRVGVVFQSYALWPHMTVAGNVGYPLAARRIPRAEAGPRVAAALAAVGLAGLEERRPAELSGGQRQRVALARCLVMEPAVVCLDEPLASLDVHLRATLRDEIVAFHETTRGTMLYVTHDQVEAMAVADRIAVMDAGRVVQLAPPATLYREPSTRMVAGFVGRGAVVPGAVLETARAGRCPVAVLGVTLLARAQADQQPGPAAIAIRSEDARLGGPGTPGVLASVRRAVYEGGRVAVELELPVAPAVQLTLRIPPADAPAPGTAVRVVVDDAWVIPD